MPHTREWMDSAAAPWVREVTTVKSTQIGGSESLLNVIAFAIAEDPGPIMFVMPSREAAEEYCDLRVLPMVELCEVLREQLGDDRGDRKLRLLKFLRCVMLFRTARVANDLSSHSIRWLFADEAEQFVGDAGKEGNPWLIALERTRTFKGRWKAYLNSTPIHADGLVWQQFLAGDRRRRNVRCCHCQAWQVFTWEQVKWPKDITTKEQMLQRREAFYECQHCGWVIDDAQKTEMCAGGEWVPEGWLPDEWIARRDAEDRATHRSYHIWAAYSPWLTWSDLVAKYLELTAAGSEREWTNKWLGLPYAEAVQKTTDDDLKKCRRDYHRGGAAPDDVLWITAGVDTQTYFLPYTVRGWAMNGRSCLLDHGRAESFAALEAALFNRDWAAGDPRRAHLHVQLVVIDARWREKEAADMARKWGPQLVRLSKASAMGGSAIYTTKLLDRHPVTRELLKEGLIEHGMNTNLLKSRVAHAIALAATGDEGAFTVYTDIDQTYVLEMTAEHLVIVRDGAKVTEQWQKKEHRRANHYWDAEVLAFAAASILQIDQVRAEMQRPKPKNEEPQQRRPRDDDDGDDGPQLWRRR